MSTKGERLKSEQRKDRNRQAKRREKMKTEGIPETHAVHRAMAESLSLVCTKQFRARAASPEVRAFLDEWGAVAARILVARGNKREHAIAAIQRQVSPRRTHTYLSNTLNPEPSAHDDI